MRDTAATRAGPGYGVAAAEDADTDFTAKGRSVRIADRLAQPLDGARLPAGDRAAARAGPVASTAPRRTSGLVRSLIRKSIAGMFPAHEMAS